MEERPEASDLRLLGNMEKSLEDSMEFWIWIFTFTLLRKKLSIHGSRNDHLTANTRKKAIITHKKE